VTKKSQSALPDEAAEAGAEKDAENIFESAATKLQTGKNKPKAKPATTSSPRTPAKATPSKDTAARKQLFQDGQEEQQVSRC
jgi:hypothetical protein